jgi:hypothetical protein
MGIDLRPACEGGRTREPDWQVWTDIDMPAVTGITIPGDASGPGEFEAAVVRVCERLGTERPESIRPGSIAEWGMVESEWAVGSSGTPQAFD